MKRKIVPIIAIVFALSLALPGFAFAASPRVQAAWGNGLGQEAGQQGSDTKEAISARYIDADGDGVCDNRGSGAGYGRGYVDSNGDGVCDNLGQGQGPGKGARAGCFGRGGGSGACGRAA